MTALLIGCALLAMLAAGLLVWGLYYYHKAAHIVSLSQHHRVNREYKLRKQREAGVVAHKSSTTATTEVIRPRKGVGYTQGDK